ncbi:MAG: hypothetical protein HZA93_22845 [Verrucomicrobia bacterium]|nr:hypothetical protein [Verrucomicrobiota bacterium]
MSFSCPHFEPREDWCLRLKIDCVPGRPGCVIGREAVFAVPVEERIRAKELERRLRTLRGPSADAARR